MAHDIEESIKKAPSSYVFKPYANAKSDIWNHFSLIYKKSDSDDSVSEIKNYCVCNKCKKVYAYKAADGTYFGTQNLRNHKCGSLSGQLLLMQCVKQKVHLTKQDSTLLKTKEVMYCVQGYNSFKSVEHASFIDLLQMCADIGTRYGKVDITDLLFKRQTISQECKKVAHKMREQIAIALENSVADGTVALSLDLYTDDYRKKCYLDVHATWISREFTAKHTALAVRHFGFLAHTAVNISNAVNEILEEYNIPIDDTPVTTDHGSNVVAALRNNVRVDCVCHRLHTVLESAWSDAKRDHNEAAAYEAAVSDLCRYVKQATGIQEQLPKSLKHGGDTRPWISMYRRADAIECSYETLVVVLTGKLTFIAIE